MFTPSHETYECEEYAFRDGRVTVGLLSAVDSDTDETGLVPDSLWRAIGVEEDERGEHKVLFERIPAYPTSQVLPSGIYAVGWALPKLWLNLAVENLAWFVVAPHGQQGRVFPLPAGDFGGDPGWFLRVLLAPEGAYGLSPDAG